MLRLLLGHSWTHPRAVLTAGLRHDQRPFRQRHPDRHRQRTRTSRSRADDVPLHRDPDPISYRYVPLRADGTYTYPGMTGTYDVLADTPHPQGSGLRGARSGSVVTLGFTTVTDVQLQPAGALQGAVLTTNGEASVNARVQLVGAAADQTYDQCASGCVPGTLAKHKGRQGVSRETRTDSLGRYGFSAVPPGVYSMTVTDPISDGRKTVSPITVTANQVAVLNVILLPVGSVLLTVRLPGGQAAVDALVYLSSDAAGFEKAAGRPTLGQLTVANVPQGNFTIRVRDTRRPDDSFYDRRVSGTIDTNGEQLSFTITFMAATTLRVTTTDGDNGNAALDGAEVYLQDTRQGGLRGVHRRAGRAHGGGRARGRLRGRGPQDARRGHRLVLVPRHRRPRRRRGGQERGRGHPPDLRERAGHGSGQDTPTPPSPTRRSSSPTRRSSGLPWIHQRGRPVPGLRRAVGPFTVTARPPSTTRCRRRRPAGPSTPASVRRRRSVRSSRARSCRCRARSTTRTSSRTTCSPTAPSRTAAGPTTARSTRAPPCWRSTAALHGRLPGQAGGGHAPARRHAAARRPGRHARCTCRRRLLRALP